MVHNALLAGGVAAVAYFAVLTTTETAESAVVPSRKIPTVQRVEDCSRFYEPHGRRLPGWSLQHGLGVGFGTFEGALPMYPMNEFPNWYGECVNWGHYSSSGTAR